jgi:peptidoglycan/LPS O-acetylase OafA/YrhL
MLVTGGITVGDRLALVSARGPGFDLIRLVAALTVVAHHAWWGVNDVLYRYSHGFIQSGLLAVITFFCISGFLVAPSLVRTGDIVRFAVHRSLRIFPALVVVVLASMFALGPFLTKDPLTYYFTSPELYLYLKNAVTLMAHYLPGVVWHGQEVQINGALWTLNIELFSYAALAALSLLGILRHRILALVILAAVYLAYVGLAVAPSLNAACPTRLSNFIGLFVYFLAGASLYLYAERVPFSGLLAAIALSLALIGLATGICSVVMPLCAPYIIVYLGLSELPGRVPLKHDLSYGVYLIHSPVILAITTLFDLNASWLVALLAAVVTMPLAYLCWRFVEEPALKRKAPISTWASLRAAALLRTRASGTAGAATEVQSCNSRTNKLDADRPGRGEESFPASRLAASRAVAR